MAKKSNMALCNIDDFLRFEIVFRKCNEALSRVFVKQWNLTSGKSKWEDSEVNRNDFINGPGKEMFENSTNVQKEFMQSKNVELWDNPLLINAIKCLNVSTEVVFEEFGCFQNKIRNVTEIGAEDDAENWWISEWMLKLPLSYTQKEVDEIKSMEIKPEPVKLTVHVPEVKKWQDSGNEAFKKGDFEKAAHCYGKGVCVPDVPCEEVAVLYSNRSVANLKLGRISEAKEDALASIRLCPTWWKGYYRLAMAYKADKEYRLALKNFLLCQRLHDDPKKLNEEINLCKRLLGEPEIEDHIFLKHDIYNNRNLEGAMAQMDGLNYYYGTCDKPQSYERAVSCFSRGATLGNPHSMFYLARMYSNGEGVKPNNNTSIKLLEKAAERPRLYRDYNGQLWSISTGVVAAQHKLGLAYEKGTVVSQNYEKSKFWYERAIRNWSGLSANNMGRMHFNGLGESKSPDLAIQYWKLGAGMGNVESIKNLVHIYSELGDVENMVRWYLYAVENKTQPILIEKLKKHFKENETQNFKPDEFENTLWREINNGPLKHLVDQEVRVLCKTEDDMKEALTAMCSLKFNFG